MKLERFRIAIPSHIEMNLCHRLVEIQRQAWGMADVDLLPAWKFFVTPRIGNGLVLCFDGDSVVGFAFLTMACDNHPFLFLDMIGVLPVYQGKGAGELLLHEAVKVAKRKNIPSVKWTFDPLETPNAHLYLRKLGAKAVRYDEDYYGELSGKHGGSATDRFWTELQVDARPFEYKGTEASLSATNYAGFSELLQKSPASIAIEVPQDFSALKVNDPVGAASVRLSTRKIFQELFRKGYVVDGFHREKGKSYYIANLESSVGESPKTLIKEDAA